MSALILALLLLVAFEIIWTQTPVLRPYRWHFRGMLALFWATVLLIAAGAAFNLAPSLYFEGIPRFASDAATYQNQAVLLANSLSSGSLQAFLAPEFFNYSRLLALLYVVFGQHASVGSVFNAVFYMASLVAIFYIGRQLFNDRAGLLAAWLFACSPTFLLHETQTLRWAATTAGLHVTTVGALLLTGPHWVFGFLFSLLGFAVLLNDLPYIARYFMFVVAIYSLVLFLYRSLGRERFVVALRMAVLAATLMTWYRLSWPAAEGSIHDRRILETLIRRDGNDGTDLRGSPARAARRPHGARLQIPLPGLSALDRLVAPALLARTGFLDETEQLRREGIELGTAIDGAELATFEEFVSNLPSAFRIALIEPTIPRLLSDSNSSSRLRKFAGVEMLFYYGITMMAVWGMAGALSSRLLTPIRSVFILLLVAGVYVLLGTTILNGGTLHRLRHPYVGLLCVFAAAGVRHLVGRFHHRQEIAALANATSVH